MPSLRYMAKSVSRFDGAKVHVYCRRKQDDKEYDISPVIPDFCWLTQFVLIKDVRFNPYGNSEYAWEEAMMVGVEEACRLVYRYPRNNPKTYSWFRRCLCNALLTWLRKESRIMTTTDSLDDPVTEEESVGDTLYLPVEAVVTPDRTIDLKEQVVRLWHDSPPVNREIQGMLERTMTTDEAQTSEMPEALALYRSVLLATLAPDKIPSAKTLRGTFNLYALLIGEEAAGRLQWLHDYSNTLTRRHRSADYYSQ